MLTRLFARLRGFWHRREIRRTLDEEIQFHVDMESAAHRARGLSPADAARQAVVDLGGPNHVREAVLDVRTSPLRRFADSCGQDVRYGLRTFARTPLAIASVVLVLAVGIGLNSAVFGAIDAVFFRALPVPKPDEMVYVTGSAAGVDFGVFADRARGSIQGLSPTESVVATLAGDDLHLRAAGEWVGANYFSVLGLHPTVGRFFVSDEDDPRNVDRAVVISHDLWTHRFGGDSAAIGRRIKINRLEHTIVGVAPAGFRGVSLPWAPTEFWATEAQQLPPGFEFKIFVASALVARLSPGATTEAVAAQVRDRPGLPPSSAPGTTNFVVRPAVGLLAPFTERTNFGFVKALADAVALMALAVMLIAASNVVGILMARGIARSTELAVRRALGAGARRLAQQLLTESLLIGATAGLAGLFVAWTLMHMYHAWSPYEMALDVGIDTPVLIYTLAVCVGAGILVGLAPARQALRVNILAGLGAPGAGTTAVARRRTRYGSVIPQMALSVGLLIIAGAHAFALAKIERRDPGYEIDNVVTVQVGPPLQYYNKPITKDIAEATNRRYTAQAMENFRALPGVAAVARTWATPASFSTFPTEPYASRTADGLGLPVAAGSTAVSADFFTVFKIPLLAGRAFDDERDTPTAPAVAIVSASVARQLAPSGAAVGEQIAFNRPTGTGGGSASPAPLSWLTIVGVVGDVLGESGPLPMVYTPTSALLYSWVPSTFVARVGVDPTSIAPAIRRALTTLDSRADVGEVLTMSEVISRANFLRRLTLALLAIAGLFGVVLAAIGLYSAVSYWVAQQARDLGVRATLGATRGDLVRLVLRDGLTTVLIACAPGIALGLVGFRLTAGLVRFVVGPIASPAFGVVAAVVGLVLVVALAACYLPGRRAAKADPLVALRQA